MYGVLLWDSDLYGEDSYITRNGMHGIACITGQEIILLHHCELNASPALESSSNTVARHVHTADGRQLHQPIIHMLFPNDTFTNTTNTSSTAGEVVKDDREEDGTTTIINDNDMQEKVEQMMLLNVFTLGCTVRNGSASATELQGFPWWRSDARFRVNQKRNNDVVVSPPHSSNNNDYNQNSSNSSSSSSSNSIGFNEECHRNGYAQTSSAVGTTSGSNSSRPTVVTMMTADNGGRYESIATLNGTYTNGASLLNGQSSHQLATIRVVDSVTTTTTTTAVAPIRRSKQSRKACADDDDDVIVKSSSKGMVAQKKSKKIRLQ